MDEHLLDEVFERLDPEGTGKVEFLVIVNVQPRDLDFQGN